MYSPGLMIKAARKIRQLTQADFAEFVGLERSQLSKYECGRVSISFANVQACVDAAGVSLDDINNYIAQHPEMLKAA